MLSLLYAVRMLGLFMVLPVLFVYGESYESSSAALLGFALGVYGLTQALMQIPLGWLSDVIGRKPVIVFGLLLFAVGSVIAATSSSIYGLIIGRALQGAGAIASTVMALLSDLTSDENRTKAMAAVGASIGLSFSVAIVLGPVLASIWGLSGIFYVALCLSILGIVVLLVGVPTPQKMRSSRESMVTLSLVWETLIKRDLAKLNVGIFILHAVLTAMFLAVPGQLVLFGFAEQSHWQLYLPIVLASFIVIVPIVLFAEKRSGIKAAFLFAVILLTVVFSLLRSVEQVWQLFLFVFLFFVAFNLLEAMLPSLVSKVSPAGTKGTALGVYSTFQFSGAFLGGAFGGYCLQHAGRTELYSVCAVLCGVWVVISLFMRKPKQWSHMSLRVSKNVTELDLADKDGVEEAIYIEADGLIYIKLDKRKVDTSELKSLLSPYLTEAI
jgi:MFS family permease